MDTELERKKTELRRSRSTLRILGSGVIALSIWSVIRPFLLSKVISLEEITTGLTAGQKAFVYILTGLIALVIILLGISLELYVGFSARSEGLGKKKGRGYVIVAVLLSAAGFFGTAVGLLQVLKSGFGEGGVLAAAAPLLLQLTSSVICAELVFAAIRVKKLSRELS